MESNSLTPWPALPYSAFKSTGYLIHMCAQIIGKLKLATPFEPHWGNVALWLTSQGLTSGPIPYGNGAFSIDLNFIQHELICRTSWGKTQKIALTTMSVATLFEQIFQALNQMGVIVRINPVPQEIANPIPFQQDTEQRAYDAALAHAWWEIVLRSYLVFMQYHARFLGATPSIGLMWGTFDLRDARYNGTPVPTTGANADYIRRNAMDMAQVEIGWWPGNEQYPQPAYFSFVYPAPEGMENAKIAPATARWEKALSEFILDYDQVRNAKDPAADLLLFLESTYKAGTTLAKWDSKLIGSGKPV